MTTDTKPTVAELVKRVLDLEQKATPGPWRNAGGYLTVRDPDRSSFVTTIYHMDEMGQRSHASPFQAVPFARAEDAKFVGHMRTDGPRLAKIASALRDAVAEAVQYSTDTGECVVCDREVPGIGLPEADGCNTGCVGWTLRAAIEIADALAAAPDGVGKEIL